MKKYREFISNTMIFAIGGIGTKVILFLLVPLYTHYLTPQEYGISDLVFTISQFIVPIITLTIYDAVTRFGLSVNEKKSDVLLSAFIVWILGTIVLIVFSPFISLYTAISDWKWYLVVYVILNGGIQIGLNYLKVIDKNKTFAIVSILNSIILVLLNLVLIVFLHTGIRGYLISNIGASFITIVIILFVGRIIHTLKLAKFDKDLLMRMVLFSAPLVLNNISWWAIHSTDKIMINAMVSATALGIYTVSSKIPSLINVFTGFFVQAWGLSSIKEVETTNETRFYSNVFKTFTASIFILCVFINCFIKPFMTIYTSEAFSNSWMYVPVLLVAATFNAVSSFFGTLYSALKKTINNMITTIIAAAVNVVVNYVFILIVGTWGAAIGTITSYFVVAYIRLFNVKKYIDFEIDWKRHILSVMIVFIHMITVTLEFHTYVMSLTALLLLLCINMETIKMTILTLKRER